MDHAKNFPALSKNSALVGYQLTVLADRTDPELRYAFVWKTIEAPKGGRVQYDGNHLTFTAPGKYLLDATIAGVSKRITVYVWPLDRLDQLGWEKPEKARLILQQIVNHPGFTDEGYERAIASNPAQAVISSNENALRLTDYGLSDGHGRIPGPKLVNGRPAGW
jgi:hypothetical protein